MPAEDDWTPNERPASWDIGATGMSLVRVALLFGSVVIALAMLVVPMLDGNSRNARYEGSPFELDTMTTSSVGDGKRYTIRRSVLQSSPEATCVIAENGARRGDC